MSGRNYGKSTSSREKSLMRYLRRDTNPCQMSSFDKEIEFLRLSEKLKTEMRHCWFSDGRRESVADHSWRLALMVFRFSNCLDQPVDILKCLKMALIHDLPEAIAGDLPVTLQNSETKAIQFEKEKAAVREIGLLLNDPHGEEIQDLWFEYEEQSTYESRFLKALDKLEAFIQHNDAPLDTWEYREKQMLFHDKYLLKFCQFDSFLYQFAQRVIEDGIQKLKEAGENVDLIREAVL